MEYKSRKGIAPIAVENYVKEPTQLMAAAAVKFYLQSYPEPVAKKLLGHIVKSQGESLQMDKEQLAALIDISVGEAGEQMEEGWAGSAVGKKVLEGIRTIKGEEIVRTLEPGFEKFLVECYRAL